MPHSRKWQDMSISVGRDLKLLKHTFRDALNKALAEELNANDNFILLGENIKTDGGSYGVTSGLSKRVRDSSRVIETPVSENLIVEAALGASLVGLDVCAEIYSSDFLFAAGNEIFNDIPKWRFQHHWEYPINLVLRMPTGAGVRWQGPEHSQCVEGYLHHVPGLTIIFPSTAFDAYHSLKYAIHSGNPIIFLEHRRLYNLPFEQKYDGEKFILNKAKLVSKGSDVTLVTWGFMRYRAEKVVDDLNETEISVELIDPVTIKPMDFDTIFKSVKKTGKLVIYEESPITGSVGAEIMAHVFEECLIEKGHGKRVAMKDVPNSFNFNVDSQLIPNETLLKATIKDICK